MSVSCLLTGHKGFIGGHLKKALEVFYDVDVYEGDLTDFVPTKNYFYIYHFAADRRNMWTGDFQKDVKITKRLLTFLNPKGRFFFASTYMVYGLDGIFSEGSPVSPINPYAQAKLECEKIISSYCSNYTIFRIGHVYGEGATHGLIKAINEAVESGEKMKVNNSGKDVMDFVNVSDVVNCIMRCFHTGIYNIGSGVCYETLALVKSSGVKYSFEEDSDAKNYTIRLDVSKAMKRVKSKFMPVNDFIKIIAPEKREAKVTIKKREKKEHKKTNIEKDIDENIENNRESE
jgi:nucleoside-diphosphate-sugar epimerase